MNATTFKHVLNKLSRSGTLLVALVIGLSYNTIQAQSDEKIGELSFESEVVNYGTIAQNENGLRVFRFTNTGNAPVVISRVKTSCGCTLASKPEKPVLPGETAQIEVNYDTKRIGKFSKSLTVESNARNPRMQLKITGEIIKKPS
ncbi:MAG: DUF1573 domain-containing protein [Flavobacteriaceae bacterium]|nr:DUF1573 domain-containing protein [Bacteroidia bacterium]NNK88839.1 DUF1573 domain-containing protein [Flavobacteriaceae bacterium]